MKYLALMLLISCASKSTQECQLIKRKEIDKSLILVYSCNGYLICRIKGEKDRVQCTKQIMEE